MRDTSPWAFDVPVREGDNDLRFTFIPKNSVQHSAMVADDDAKMTTNANPPSTYTVMTSTMKAHIHIYGSVVGEAAEKSEWI